MEITLPRYVLGEICNLLIKKIKHSNVVNQQGNYWPILSDTSTSRQYHSDRIRKHVCNPLGARYWHHHVGGSKSVAIRVVSPKMEAFAALSSSTYLCQFSSPKFFLGKIAFGVKVQ